MAAPAVRGTANVAAPAVRATAPLTVAPAAASRLRARGREACCPALYSSDVADLPFSPGRPELSERLIDALDAEGKIARALIALGMRGGADVVVLGDQPARTAALRETPAATTVVALSAEARPPSDAAVADLLGGLPAGSADVLVGLWSSFAGPCPASTAAADRVLRPGGRLLVVQDYGRDDLDVVRGAERTAELVRWSRRGGSYLGAGFRIRVVHGFCTFETIEEAQELLVDTFAERGAALAAVLRRPRLSWNVAIYHRTRPAP